MRAEVWVREVVKHHESKQEESQDDRQGYGEEAELLDSVPLADGDVRDKDEGGQNSEDEPSDLSEAVCLKLRKRKYTKVRNFFRCTVIRSCLLAPEGQPKTQML